ncbi:MAG: hypothetical protein ACK4F0_07985 [Candidatus Ratteibacteria bacterium]
MFYKNKVFLIGFIFLILGNKIWTQEKDKEEFIKKGLEYSISLIQTAECDYFVERQCGEKYIKRYKVDWKYSKNREVLNAEYLDENEKVYQKIQFFFDGSKTIVISYHDSKTNASIHDGLIPNMYLLCPPSTFLFHFYPGVFLKKILSSNNLKIQKIAEVFKNEECYILIYQGEPPNDLIYKLWLSSNKNFLPTKIEIIVKEETLVAEIDYEKKNSIWFPAKILGYQQNKRGIGPYTRVIYQNIKINSQIDENLFIPILKSGISIYDVRLGISYITSGNNNSKK